MINSNIRIFYLEGYNINFKGDYFNFKFFLPNQNYSGPWTKSSESMDKIDSVHGLPGLSPWTLSSLQVSMDKVQTGHRPTALTGLCPWTRLFPECPWTLSGLSNKSMVKITVSIDSLDIIHEFPGLSTDRVRPLDHKKNQSTSTDNFVVFIRLKTDKVTICH